MRLRLMLLMVLTTASVAASPLHAQGRSFATPEAAATAFEDALRTQQYAEAASLMHPEALAKLRAMLLPLAKHENGAELRQKLLGANSVAEVEALDDAALFERFLRSMMGLSPEIQSIMGTAETGMVGHVMEGPDIAHVVYRLRLRVEGMTFTKLEVMSLQRAGSEWKVLLKGDVEGMVEAIRRQIEG